MLRKKLLTQHSLFMPMQKLADASVRHLQLCERSSLMYPNVIFCENHEDPATGMMLNELAPFFYQAKYREFYDEAPTGTSLKNRSMVVEMSCQSYIKLKTIMAAHNLDVDQEAHVKQFLFASYIREERLPPKSLVETYMSLGRIICAKDSLRYYQAFLNSMPQYGFNYSGIDSDDDITTIHLDEVHSRRDKQMAGAYLRTTEPVFGKIGLGHVQGIQAVMSATDSIENLSARFSFFYLYSKPATSKLNNMEHHAREGTLPLHWDMHSIDCSQRSKADIVAEIQEIIEDRQEDLQVLARKACRRLG